MGSFINAWDAVTDAIKAKANKIGIPEENIKRSGPETVFLARSVAVWCEVEPSEKSEGGARTRLLSAYIAVSGDTSQKLDARYASAMTCGRRVQRALKELRIAGNTALLIEEPEVIDVDKASFCVVGIKASWRFLGEEPWEDES